MSGRKPPKQSFCPVWYDRFLPPKTFTGLAKPFVLCCDLPTAALDFFVAWLDF